MAAGEKLGRIQLGNVHDAASGSRLVRAHVVAACCFVLTGAGRAEALRPAAVHMKRRLHLELERRGVVLRYRQQLVT
jgi:hypothetical protein